MSSSKQPRRKKRRTIDSTKDLGNASLLTYSPCPPRPVVVFLPALEPTPFRSMSTGRCIANVVGPGNEEGTVEVMEANPCSLVANTSGEDSKLRSNALNLGLLRASETAQKLAVEFFLTAGELFNKHQYHGSLKDHVVIRTRDSNRMGDTDKEDYIVTIIPPPVNQALKDPNDIAKMQFIDLEAVKAIVFGDIFPALTKKKKKGEGKGVVEADMDDLLTELNRNIAISRNDIKIRGEKSKDSGKYSDHTALWSPQRRLNFLQNLQNINKTCPMEELLGNKEKTPMNYIFTS